MSAKALACVFAAGVLAAPAAVQAQPFPSRAVHVIVPFAPGGGPDVLSRMIGERLSRKWAQPVVIDTKPGAGGIIGTELGAKARPDGYTLVFADSSTMAISPNLRAHTPYDPFRSFAPVTLAATAPMLLVVSPKLGVTSVKELVALLRASPGKFSYATPGTATPHHIAMERFKRQAGLDVVHVPFKGVQPAIPSLYTGEVAMMFASSATINFGYVVPAGTPAEVVSRLSAEIGGVVRSDDARRWMAGQGMDAVGSSPAQYLAATRAEFEAYADVIKAAGIRAD
ncbi:MAG: Bug family tripartite tricarboxylate transporter substrate binding protein [Betaproteobacteria bacterium]